ncbi:MAG: FAD-dependent oxidoreductase [Pseudomonadota bacterium]
MTFSHLFTPYKIRHLEIANRIFSSSHQTTMGENGAPGDRLAAYHEARARGGAGLIIMESSRPIGDDVSAPYYLNSSTDDCIPGYRKVAEAVHRHDCRLFAQVNHGGRIAYMYDGMQLTSNAPSLVPDHRYRCMPRVMSTEYVQELIEAFATAAGRMAEAGVDGIELAASHGLLMAQFLNPQTNFRDDQYGGSAENRFRFVAECIAATRRKIGSDKILGIRVSIDEFEPDGIGADEWLAICRRLDAEPELDFIDVTAGSMMGFGGSIHVVPPMQVEHAYLAPLAGQVKALVSKTVMVAGRINQPQIAEQVLAAGQADLCGMTRAMIADPEMPNKAREGALDDIRACIGCNQACIGHLQMGVPISCIQNPQSGRESTLQPVVATATPRSVLVVGGGPAGMKAASTAAARGHAVTLCESSGQLGGQAILAQRLPNRAEFGGIIDNLTREMDNAGVAVQLNTTATRDWIESTQFDTVVLATGAVPFRPERDLDMEIADDVAVADAWQILRDEVQAGNNVVIADWRGDWVGIGLAEKLASEGCAVRLCVDAEMPGQHLQLYLRTLWVCAIHKLGVQITTHVRLFGADGDTVFFYHNASGEPEVFEGVDTLVLAQGHKSVTDLEQSLIGSDIEVHTAGDCRSPRSAEEAVYEGMMVARDI